jgi:hypothetical protein
VICGVTIGEHAFIGAGAVVTSDVPAHGFVVGNLGRLIGWACICGERLPADLHCGCGRVFGWQGMGWACKPPEAKQVRHPAQPAQTSDLDIGTVVQPRTGRIPSAVLAFGAVSLLTDVSSESVAAVLPLHITAVLGMGPLAYGFIDGGC